MPLNSSEEMQPRTQKNECQTRNSRYPQIQPYSGWSRRIGQNAGSIFLYIVGLDLLLRASRENKLPDFIKHSLCYRRAMHFDSLVPATGRDERVSELIDSLAFRSGQLTAGLCLNGKECTLRLRRE